MGKYNINFYEFTDSETLLLSLVPYITGQLKKGISQNGQASLLVSGGSTPVPLFEALSHQELEWSNISIALVDERWVPPSDPDSNEKLVRCHLLQNRAKQANFVGMTTGTPNAKEGEQACEQKIAALPLPFDVLILGMGNDGHTASLFPDASNLKLATDLDSGRTCLAMTPKAAPHQRMTLTLPAILKANAIILHLVGDTKRAVLKQALNPTGPEDEMPIRHVLINAPSPVQVYWAP